MIEKLVQSPFHKLEIPLGKDVCRKQFFFGMERLLQADISHGDYENYIPMLQEKFAEMSKEEVLTRVAALEFDRYLKYYQNSEDLNLRESDRNDRSRDGFRTRERTERNERGDRTTRTEKGERGSRDSKSSRDYSTDGDYTKLFINIGTKDGFYKASFLQFILDMSDLKKDTLGKIDLKDANSFVEIDKSSASKMIKAIDGKSFKGRMIRMNEMK